MSFPEEHFQFYTLNQELVQDKFLSGDKYIVGFIILSTILILATDLITPLGVAGGVLYLLPVLVTIWLPSAKNTHLIAIICSCLVVIGFYFSPEGADKWQVLLNRALALFSIWVSALVVISHKNQELLQEIFAKKTSTYHQNAQMLQMIMDTVPAMITYIDTEQRYQYINASNGKFLNSSSINKQMTEVMDKEVYEVVEPYVKQALSGQQTSCDFKHVAKDGKISIYDVKYSPHTNAEGKVLGLCMISSDITEAIIEAQQFSLTLSHQERHDALTGLLNRMGFKERLVQLLDSTKTDETEHAMCYLDLDQFKLINDTCGHVAGDELLRQISELLVAAVGKQDTVARLGGDEFGILMEYCSLADAERRANSLCIAIGKKFFIWEGRHFDVRVSIGVVAIDKDNNGSTESLKAADSACYIARDAGRNRIYIYNSDDIQYTRRSSEMQIISEINRVLKKDLFTFDAQAIIPLNSANHVGQHYEVLLRMKDSTGKPVSPGIFLPAAERYGIATRIDRWVITAIMAFLSSHPEFVKTLKMLSINLSGHSVADKGFLKFIKANFQIYEVPTDKICFEITETATINSLSEAIFFINSLKEQGCLFSLDDFGSGLSSFAYLKNLPVDYLKIDGAFVKDIVENEVDLSMVKSISDIGDNENRVFQQYPSGSGHSAKIG